VSELKVWNSTNLSGIRPPDEERHPAFRREALRSMAIAWRCETSSEPSTFEAWSSYRRFREVCDQNAAGAGESGTGVTLDSFVNGQGEITVGAGRDMLWVMVVMVPQLVPQLAGYPTHAARGMKSAPQGGKSPARGDEGCLFTARTGRFSQSLTHAQGFTRKLLSYINILLLRPSDQKSGLLAIGIP